MCEHYKYMLQIKPEYDIKFQKTGIHSQMVYLCEVEDVKKGIFQLNYDKKRFNLLVKECGKCHICRYKRASIKACQAQSEYKTAKKGAFITLTFGEKQMTDYIMNNKRFNDMSDYKKKKYIKYLQWTLEKEEFVKFMKRLRWKVYQDDLYTFSLQHNYFDNIFKKNGEKRNKIIKLDKYDYTDFKPRKIRFMHCGEYGEDKGRPHHHAIIYGINFGFDYSKVRWSYKKQRNVVVHFNNLLNELWQFGDVTTDNVTYQTCNYVARYITKKHVNKNKDYQLHDIAGSMYRGRLPEYCTQSNRHGLGYDYYMQNADKINKDLQLFFKNNKGEIKSCPLPRYYKELMRKYYKQDWLRMQKKSIEQQEEFSSTPVDFLYSRMLKDRKKIKTQHSAFVGDLEKSNISYEKSRYLEFELKKQVFDDLYSFKDRYLANYTDTDFVDNSEYWRITCYKNFERYRKHMKTVAINEYVKDKFNNIPNSMYKLSKKVETLKLMDNPFKRDNLDNYAKICGYDDRKVRERWLNYEPCIA